MRPSHGNERAAETVPVGTRSAATSKAAVGRSQQRARRSAPTGRVARSGRHQAQTERDDDQGREGEDHANNHYISDY